MMVMTCTRDIVRIFKIIIIIIIQELYILNMIIIEVSFHAYILTVL